MTLCRWFLTGRRARSRAGFGFLGGGGLLALWMAASPGFGGDPSHLRVLAEDDPQTPENYRLVWSATAGRRYEVWQSQDLRAWQVVPGSAVVATGPAHQLPILTAGPSRFFRVVELVEVPPALPPLRMLVESDPRTPETHLLVWSTQPGRRYEVWQSTDLQTWQRVAGYPQAAQGTTQQMAMVATGPGRYFRVQEAVELPPGMALVPAGAFMMGDAHGEGDADERPVRAVFVSGFFMDQTEVTKAMWDGVRTWALTHGYTFDNPGSGKATNHPVHSITWYDAVKWCNARSEKEGREPAYYTSAARTTVYRTGVLELQNEWVKWDAGYRLPTEAEWEKAARGGLDGQRFPWGETITHSRANYISSAAYSYDVSPTRGHHPTYAKGAYPYTSPAGAFGANGYGLRDMAGNVWEWCWDRYGETSYAVSPSSDPHGPASGVNRVLRGGSWLFGPAHSRVTFRSLSWPGRRYDVYGFRTVLPHGQP